MNNQKQLEETQIDLSTISIDANSLQTEALETRLNLSVCNHWNMIFRQTCILPDNHPESVPHDYGTTSTPW